MASTRKWRPGKRGVIAGLPQQGGQPGLTPVPLLLSDARAVIPSDVNAMLLTEPCSLQGLGHACPSPPPPCTCAHNNNNSNSQLASTYQYHILYTSFPVTVGLDDPYLISEEVKLGEVYGLTRPHSRFKLPGPLHLPCPISGLWL